MKEQRTVANQRPAVPAKVEGGNEYAAFADALRTVLRVDPAELKPALEAERRGRTIRKASGR